MKKQLVILGAVLSLSLSAQKQEPVLQPCNTFSAMEEAFKADPALKAKYEAIQSQLEVEYQKLLKDKASSNHSASRTAATQSIIPVVFHIMGPQSITDQVFINLISYINNDFGRTGPDVASINPTFAPLYVDSDIRFALAKKDPTGKCTNGIIRHDSENSYWSQSSPSYNYTGNGAGRWSRDNYLNIYVVECISGSGITCPPVPGGLVIGGYTYLPGSAPNANSDAIVVLKSQLAQTDQTDSRTLSHEIGHWLNLRHTFGNSNSPQFGLVSNPPNTACGSATLNDGVSDTPETKGYQSVCPATYPGDCTSLPNIENIMDYASCPRMFTQGQITRMQTALGSSTANRNNLWTTSNMNFTGIGTTYTCSAVAAFDANKRSVCAGSAVTYTNESQVGSSGSVSWTFEGGSPTTSTVNNPVVTYATPGTYSVNLVATNSAGSNTVTQASYITVVQGGGGASIPNVHNFDSGSLPGITVINNNSGSVAWALNTSTGADGTAQSIYLNNASQTSSGGQVDMFETPVYNLSNTTNVGLSYYYAYAKKTSAQLDSFKVQYSIDCGGTWTSILGVPATNNMATASGGVLATSFSPSAAQWKQTTISPVLLSALNNKPSVKLRYWFKSDVAAGSSNNIYIDQINISGSVGLNELENAMDMLVYPNPTNASSTIDFNMPSNEKMKLNVTDVLGRSVEESDRFELNGNRASYTVNKNGSLAKGVYIISIYSGAAKVSKKLIIE